MVWKWRYVRLQDMEMVGRWKNGWLSLPTGINDILEWYASDPDRTVVEVENLHAKHAPNAVVMHSLCHVYNQTGRREECRARCRGECPEVCRAECLEACRGAYRVECPEACPVGCRAA